MSEISPTASPRSLTEPHKAGLGDCSSPPPHAARLRHLALARSRPRQSTLSPVHAPRSVSSTLGVRTGGCPHTLRMNRAIRCRGPAPPRIGFVDGTNSQGIAESSGKPGVVREVQTAGPPVRRPRYLGNSTGSARDGPRPPKSLRPRSPRGAARRPCPCRTAVRTSPRRWRRRPAVRPRMSHSCASASLPANRAGPVDRAGFTEVLVTGMLTRWIRVRPVRSPSARSPSAPGCRSRRG